MRVGWFKLFDQALRSSAVVAVWSTVERHLERPLTRDELLSARRAANRYATVTGIRILRVPAPATGVGSGVRTIPLLVRPDADLADLERLEGNPPPRPIAGTHHRAAEARQRGESAVSSAVRAATMAPGLRTGKITPGAATALADELADALVALADLEHRLRLRGRS